ncbi:phosphate ABC transporter substrate-binding protein [Algimonas arctica]|uniref:Phosphate ABC transporter substrate-binding protein n=1 Tax=Algimonas arctica TaxID=1479486 RepID=A0A8J3CSH7_9PROT|nr:substrate-binding domain-containing protein [Algimonas arctica]GHB03429.1 phosphate ABC transporter substrate-binding protein [Algimonas arctica]
MFKKILLCSVAAFGLSACGNGGGSASDTSEGTAETTPFTTGRDQIKIVGSSTVYPFATTVAENFGRSTSFKTPIVEATGSGGGLKLFCSGLGDNFPDITNASRRIKASEVKRCAENGITDIVEVKIGYDGIVVANSTKSDRMELTLRELYLALAKDVPDGNGGLKPNDYIYWSDINPTFKSTKIEIMGPPPTSGTRDAFVELAMEGGCQTFDWIKALKETDSDTYKAICHAFREDDSFIEAGENDNLIVRKLNANPNALGIFGFGFLDQNGDSVQGSVIDGTPPTFENISDGTYPVSRSLYFYVKKDLVGTVPGITEYLTEFTSVRASGQDGYLSEKGLIPMNVDEHAQWQSQVLALETLSLN